MERTDWTDERLNESFDRLTGEMAALRGDMRVLAARMDGLEHEVRHLRDDFSGLYRVLLGGTVGIVAGLFAALATAVFAATQF